MLASELELTTNVEIAARPAGSDLPWVPISNTKNKTTDATKMLIAQHLANLGSLGVRVRYLEIGTGTTPAQGSDVSLEQPYARFEISEVPTVDINRVFFTFFLPQSQSNLHIREIGMFGGLLASGSLGTGVLVARSLADVDNTNIQSELRITWRMTVG